MNELILFPTNWLYNSSVVGFLNVISQYYISEKKENSNLELVEISRNYGEQIEKDWIKEDGTIIINKEIFNEYRDTGRSVALQLYYEYYNNSPPIIGNSFYKNFVNPSTREKDLKCLNQLSTSLKNMSCSDDICSTCMESYSIETNDAVMKEFIDKRSSYNMMNNSDMAPSPSFPNSFWNLKDSIKLCPLCIYLSLHSKASSYKSFSKEEIFINAPSFKLMWFLNKFNKSFSEPKQALSMSIIEFSQKVQMNFGKWSGNNIEIIKNSYNDGISYYSLPVNTIKLLMDKGISSLITSSREPVILDIVLNNDFERLLKINHKILSKVNTEKLSEIRYKDDFSIKRLSEILPQLYVRIKTILKEEN